MNIKIREIISPSFWNIFNSKSSYMILQGGRGSAKTSFASLKIVYHCISEENCSVIILRKYQNTLRNSVFKEIKKASSRLGLTDGVDYIANVSPMKITFFNGNSIYFAGTDDIEKLKGFIDESRPIKILWIEEASEFENDDDFQQAIATFSRGNNDYFISMFSYNPPKNKYSFINIWAEKMQQRDDVLYSHTDYRTVPKEWLGKKFIDEAERLKKYDEKRYRWIYLGEVIGIEGLIYNPDLFKIKDQNYIKENKLKCLYIDLAIDAGYSTSATTCLAIGYMSDGEWYLLDTYYYSPVEQSSKKAPSDFADDIFNFRVSVSKEYQALIDNETIDSAETALVNEMFKKFGINLHKVNKGNESNAKEKLIDFSQDFLATNKFNVINNSNNKIFLKETKEYMWIPESIEKGKPMPDKKEKEMKSEDMYYNTHSKNYAYSYGDHTCDAFQYFVRDNLQKIGLEF